jgi:two-component system, OmpR family, response regulator
MRIFVVEDDRKIASFVVKGLKEAGFAVDQAEDGEEGLHLALSQPTPLRYGVGHHVAHAGPG